MWTYLKYDNDGDLVSGEKAKFPNPATICLAFDALRWRTVIGYVEKDTGCFSILTPNVCDDCNVVAFAPLSETTNPDPARIIENTPWKGPLYSCTTVFPLLR